MYNSPWCRDWAPLMSQQLRLRDLIQISGHDISSKCSMYYTLHVSPMSSPVYTSELVEPHTIVDWNEIINCPQLSTSSARSVCIRVWEKCENCEGHSKNDKIIFLWGVYFSGLVQINRHDAKLKKNSLIFHMKGGYFTSLNCVLDHGEHEDSLTDQKNVLEPLCDSDSISVNGNGVSLALPIISKKSPDYSGTVSPKSPITPNYFEGSPAKSQIFDSPANVSNESYPNLDELRKRFLEMDFSRSETQVSYKVDKLLKLQNKQRQIKYRKEQAKVLVDQICTKSAYCLNLELIANKPFFYEPQKQPGMGKALSRLLSSQKEPPKPETLLKAQELRRKIECAKFKCKMLRQERDSQRQVNKKNEVTSAKLTDENIEMESWILNSFRSLSRESDKIEDDKSMLLIQREMFLNLKMALFEAKRTLLKELNEIYCIVKNDRGLYTINNIHLPDAESYTDTSSSTEISVALGYVAHAVLVCARIIDIPLRNPIKHEGSRSKIIDNIKVLTPNEKIFQLFCRVSPPPNTLLYGVFLLNQNISQLKFLLSLNRGDLRATLSNLNDVLNGMCSDLHKRHLHKGFLENVPPVSVSHSSSNELSIRIPLQSPTRNCDNFGTQRICKSVGGSYEESFLTNKSKSNSEPILDNFSSNDRNHSMNLNEI